MLWGFTVKMLKKLDIMDKKILVIKFKIGDIIDIKKEQPPTRG